MSEQQKQQRISHKQLKSGKFYAVVVFLWLLSVVYLGYTVYVNVRIMHDSAAANRILVIVIYSVIVLMLMLFWFVSMREFCVGVGYLFNRRKLKKHHQIVKDFKLEFNKENPEPKVLILYCTYNDFIPVALERSMQQDYGNFETVILDDSTNEDYKKEIDEFAARTGATVVRRENREGFKAGNLNSYLKDKTDYDYFVVLDSDEVIPPDYIHKALKYFYCFDKVGGVQARHISWNEQNAFMNVMAPSVLIGGTVTGNVSQLYGQNVLYGHGIMISRDAYVDAGGFPHIVIEDGGISIEMLAKGYAIYHADDIVCKEEYPVDYTAYKKRQWKFVQGNFEVIKKYNSKILKMDAKWYQKIDIMLSIYPLAIIPFLSILVTLGFMAMAFLGCHFERMIGVFVLCIFFLVVPMIISMIVHTRNMNIFKMILFLVCNLLLFGSMLVMMVVTIACCIFGMKARFVVTPKKSEKVTFWYAIKFNYKEIICAIIIGVLSYFANGSILPVAIIIAGLLSSIPLTLISNVRQKNVSREEVEQEIQTAQTV